MYSFLQVSWYTDAVMKKFSLLNYCVYHLAVKGKRTARHGHAENCNCVSPLDASNLKKKLLTSFQSSFLRGTDISQLQEFLNKKDCLDPFKPDFGTDTAVVTLTDNC